MTRIMRTFMTAYIFFLASQILSAYDFESNGIYYDISSESNLTVCVTYKNTSYNSYGGEITIPSTVIYSNKSYSVTSIGKSAFQNCTELTKVQIPESVESIGNDAFRDCSSLSEVNLPNKITTISAFTFLNCSSLKRIVIPPLVSSINDRAFLYCTNLTNVYNCSALKFNIGSFDYGYVAYYGDTYHVHNNCHIEEDFIITTNEGKEYICGYLGAGTELLFPTAYGVWPHTFQGDTTLTNVTLPNGIKFVGIHAFSGCRNLREIIFPESATEVSYDAFQNNPATKTIIINNIDKYKDLGFKNFDKAVINGNVPDVLSAESRYFSESNFKEVVISENADKIGKYAFYNMLNLEKIAIGSNVNKIGSYAFTGCSNLSEMYCNPAIPAVCASTAFDEDTKLFCDVFVPEGSLSNYQSADLWKEFRSIGTFTEPISTGTTCNMADADVFSSGGTVVYDELTYSRTFTNTNWQALYVPFSIPVDSLTKYGLQVAELNDTHQWDFNGDGIADSTRVEFFTLTSGNTEANHPYLIRATEPTTLSLTLTDIEVKAAEENSIECSSTKQKFTFVGTYTGVSGADMYDNNYYGMSGGGLKRVSNNTVSLKPQRWYMKIENKNGSPVNYFAPSIRFTVDGIDEEEEETSAIVDMCTESRNRHKAFYSLEGIRQNTAPTQRGMYVLQDKKLIIR